VYNCPSSGYQTCTNDFIAQAQCVSSSSLLVDNNVMAQAYSNGNCVKTANQDASEPHAAAAAAAAGCWPPPLPSS
jgi:hypothetical protein